MVFIQTTSSQSPKTWMLIHVPDLILCMIVCLVCLRVDRKSRQNTNKYELDRNFQFFTFGAQLAVFQPSLQTLWTTESMQPLAITGVIFLWFLFITFTSECEPECCQRSHTPAASIFPVFWLYHEGDLGSYKNWLMCSKWEMR